MTVEDAIKATDMDEVIDALNAYAISRLRTVGIKDFDGKEPIDLVGDLLHKVIEGQRDWSKAQCSFREFLFGCLRSDINAFFKARKNKFDEESPEIAVEDVSLDIEAKKKQVLQLLSAEGADGDELVVFEYWMDGMRKASEIAQDLDVPVKEIYNITKRLERRLSKIQNEAIQII